MHSVIDPYPLLRSIFCTLSYTASPITQFLLKCTRQGHYGHCQNTTLQKYVNYCSLTNNRFCIKFWFKSFQRLTFHLDWDPGPLSQKKYLLKFAIQELSNMNFFTRLEQMTTLTQIMLHGCCNYPSICFPPPLTHPRNSWNPSSASFLACFRLCRSPPVAPLLPLFPLLPLLPLRPDLPLFPDVLVPDLLGGLFGAITARTGLLFNSHFLL